MRIRRKLGNCNKESGKERAADSAGANPRQRTEALFLFTLILLITCFASTRQFLSSSSVSRGLINFVCWRIMDLGEMSIMYHVVIVLFMLFLLSSFDLTHPFAFFLSLIYLYMVHDRYLTKLRKKLQYEETKQANSKRVLSDSETVRWLNHAVEKIWPICMEDITSQKFLLPIIPWFLEKYKPWTAKKAVVQHLYMGRDPPILTDMRVLRQCTGDDHLALEMGLRFCTADDMSAILSVKLRRMLGFGMWTKLHITGLQVEGKVLVGIKFLRRWPFIGRLRLCFAEPPYFQMTVKPIFTHGVDVTVLPGIAGWLEKLLSMAFEQTLVQPNMLVADVEKFVSPCEESWFSVHEKKPIAYAKLEVIEASDMKPSDLNGLADPYVKGKLGPYGFRTKTQWKTLAPKWLEEFEIPIVTWESPNAIAIEVCDKDHFIDDSLGNCTVNINDLRDGERHDMWLPLQNIKIGRLHLALTVHEVKEVLSLIYQEGEDLNKQDVHESFANDTVNRSSFSSMTSEVSEKVADNFEPINIEGQQETRVWIHHPGAEVSQTWEPRKGKTRQVEYTRNGKALGDSFGSSISSGVQCNDSSSTDEATEGIKPGNRLRRGLRKITEALRKIPKDDSNPGSYEEAVHSPCANIRAVVNNQKEGGVKFVVEDSLSGRIHGQDSKQLLSSLDLSSIDSPGRGNKKEKAKCILKHMEKSARSLKHMLSRKGSRHSRGDPQLGAGLEMDTKFDTSDDNDKEESVPSVQPHRRPNVVNPVKQCYGSNDDSDNAKEKSTKVGPIENVTTSEEQSDVNNGEEQGIAKIENNNKGVGSSEEDSKVQEEALKTTKESVEDEKK
ncbi:C2 domain-containing protein At1g53590 [Linum perenne]